MRLHAVRVLALVVLQESGIPTTSSRWQEICSSVEVSGGRAIMTIRKVWRQSLENLDKIPREESKAINRVAFIPLGAGRREALHT